MAPVTPSASADQIEALLRFLNKNKDLARGLLRGAEGRVRSKKLWEEIAMSLNSMGGVVKTVEQWQRVWADRKHLTKKSLISARRAACTDSIPTTSLTPVELKILSIVGESFADNYNMEGRSNPSSPEPDNFDVKTSRPETPNEFHHQINIEERTAVAIERQAEATERQAEATSEVARQIGRLADVGILLLRQLSRTNTQEAEDTLEFIDPMITTNVKRT